MNHHDAEISDVLIVLDCIDCKANLEAIGRLKDLGLEVVDVNEDEGVVEGRVDAGKVPELKKVPGVAYVRSVFTYTADYPGGDARDQDGQEAVEDNDD